MHKHTPRCSGYHYCTTSFNWAWTQVLHRLKPCSRRVGDSRWWGSLTMVPAGNKAKHLSSINHTTKTIHHHHHNHHHHQGVVQKYPKVEFFIGSLLQIFKANDFDRDGCRTFIVQFPCRKMKSILFAQIISGKTASRS